MRVLQVHNRHRHPGGEDVVVGDERRLLLDHGHQVEPLMVDNPGDPLAAAMAVARSPWNPAAARRVAEAAQDFQADVVHVHNTWFSLSPAVFGAVARSGRPVVATLHNFRTVCVNANLLRDGRACDRCVGTHPGRGVVHRCYRGSAVLSVVAAGAIVLPRRRHTWERDVSQFLVLDAAGVPALVAGGIPEDLITVRPNFVPDPGPRPAPPSSADEVIFAGRLSEEKGADVLLEAWQRAAPGGLRLTVYGDGPLREHLQRLAGPGVSFPGRVDRRSLTAAMLQARALVFPSVCQEAGPLAPIEAAGAGLPLVMSRLLGMASGLASGGAGWSVPPGDPGALAGALARLVDPVTVDRAGRAARQMYLSRHSARAAIRSLEAVYEAAVLHSGDATVNGTRTDAPAT